MGTVGYTEPEAEEKFGKGNIKIYTSKFVNMFYSMTEHKPQTGMKLICFGENEIVVGLHVIGLGADEMVQGFGVAIKMGATKTDFDNCVAIHPTGRFPFLRFYRLTNTKYVASEEFVTMSPWGKIRDQITLPPPKTKL